VFACFASERAKPNNVAILGTLYRPINREPKLANRLWRLHPVGPSAKTKAFGPSDRLEGSSTGLRHHFACEPHPPGPTGPEGVRSVALRLQSSVRICKRRPCFATTRAPVHHPGFACRFGASGRSPEPPLSPRAPGARPRTFGDHDHYS